MCSLVMPARQSTLLPYTPPPGGVDVAILTITPVELRAARAVFHTSNRYAVQGNRRFYSGTIRSNLVEGAPLSLVVTSSNEPHNIPAVQAVADIRQYCDPKILFLLGIAAGDRTQVRVGDVIIPEAVHYYEPERLTDALSEPRHDRANVPNHARAQLYHYSLPAKEFLRELSSLLRKLPPRETPRLGRNFQPAVFSHNAIIASGANLLADGRFLPDLRDRHDQRLIAADQESWGFAKGSEGILWAIFRGISDYGDPRRYDRWRYVAACCAALCLKTFLKDDYVPPNALPQSRPSPSSPFLLGR